ncbi:MAG: hypothetical protein K2X66_19215, partial [Cyanobacteria bacterium]|nr:hypothetical protein [Cyanobacteriota bacterium]
QKLTDYFQDQALRYQFIPKDIALGDPQTLEALGAQLKQRPMSPNEIEAAKRVVRDAVKLNDSTGTGVNLQQYLGTPDEVLARRLGSAGALREVVKGNPELLDQWRSRPVPGKPLQDQPLDFRLQLERAPGGREFLRYLNESTNPERTVRTTAGGSSTGQLPPASSGSSPLLRSKLPTDTEAPPGGLSPVNSEDRLLAEALKGRGLRDDQALEQFVSRDRTGLAGEAAVLASPSKTPTIPLPKTSEIPSGVSPPTTQRVALDEAGILRLRGEDAEVQRAVLQNVVDDLTRRNGIPAKAAPKVQMVNDDANGTGFFDPRDTTTAFSRGTFDTETIGHEFEHFRRAVDFTRLSLQDKPAFRGALLDGVVDSVGVRGTINVIPVAGTMPQTQNNLTLPATAVPKVKDALREVLADSGIAPGGTTIQDPKAFGDAVRPKVEKLVASLSDTDIKALGGVDVATAKMTDYFRDQALRFQSLSDNLLLRDPTTLEALGSQLKQRPLSPNEIEAAMRVVRDGPSYFDSMGPRVSTSQYLNAPDEVLARRAGATFGLREVVKENPELMTLWRNRPIPGKSLQEQPIEFQKQFQESPKGVEFMRYLYEATQFFNK